MDIYWRVMQMEKDYLGSLWARENPKENRKRGNKREEKRDKERILRDT